MAQAAIVAPAPAQNRRRGAENAEQIRAVRQRVDDNETRLAELASTQRGQEVRLQFLEQPLRWVLRMFDSAQIFSVRWATT